GWHVHPSTEEMEPQLHFLHRRPRLLPAELAELGPVGEGEAGAKVAEGVVAGYEGQASGESMSSNEHVHGGETLALFPGEGGEAGKGLSSGRIARQRGHSQEKLIY